MNFNWQLFSSWFEFQMLQQVPGLSALIDWIDSSHLKSKVNLLDGLDNKSELYLCFSLQFIWYLTIYVIWQFLKLTSDKQGIFQVFNCWCWAQIIQLWADLICLTNALMSLNSLLAFAVVLNFWFWSPSILRQKWKSLPCNSETLSILHPYF